MSFKVYDIAEIAGETNFHEYNVAIINGDKVILSDNEAVHTISSMDDVVIPRNGKTARDIINSTPVEEIENIGEWIRVFGNRIEINYNLLLKSIKKIGLNPKNFPRKV